MGNGIVWKKKKSAWYRPLHQNNGKWYYVCTFDNVSTPVGYCAPGGICEACHYLDEADPDCELCGGSKIIKNKNQCDGHYNAIDAVKHYREWQADRMIVGKEEPGRGQRFNCELCLRPTLDYMESGSIKIYACPYHLKREDFIAAAMTRPHHHYE